MDGFGVGGWFLPKWFGMQHPGRSFRNDHTEAPWQLLMPGCLRGFRTLIAISPKEGFQASEVHPAKAVNCGVFVTSMSNECARNYCIAIHEPKMLEVLPIAPFSTVMPPSPPHPPMSVHTLLCSLYPAVLSFLVPLILEIFIALPKAM